MKANSRWLFRPSDSVIPATSKADLQKVKVPRTRTFTDLPSLSWLATSVPSAFHARLTYYSESRACRLCRAVLVFETTVLRVAFVTTLLLFMLILINIALEYI